MSDPDVHLRKFQKELSTGTVSLALLAVLARAPEPMYGYLIAKELERVGDGVLSGKQSALYPVLLFNLWATFRRRWILRLQWIAGATALAGGLAVGREGGMILLSALTASLIAARLAPEKRSLFTACGAAAGVAALVAAGCLLTGALPADWACIF